MKCHFSRGGSEVIIGSKHKSFYVYDLEGNDGVTFRPKVKGSLMPALCLKFHLSSFIKKILMSECEHFFFIRSVSI